MFPGFLENFCLAAISLIIPLELGIKFVSLLVIEGFPLFRISGSLQRLLGPQSLATFLESSVAVATRVTTRTLVFGYLLLLRSTKIWLHSASGKYLLVVGSPLASR